MFTKRLTQIIIAFSVCLAIFLSFQMINDINNLKQDVQTFQQELTAIQAQQADINKRIQSWQPVATVTAEPTATYKRDVPLSDELQQFTYSKCVEYGVDYDLVLAIMREESQFTPGAISDNGEDYGIMQINVINHDWLAEKGLTNMLDSKQNITAGVIILSQLQGEFDSTESVLMAYNLGQAKANKYLAKGINTTEYVEKVMNNG